MADKQFMIRTELEKRGLSEDEIKAVRAALRETHLLNKVESFRALSEGMTNRLFIIKSGGEEYIVRAPGEGSEMLIDRKAEAMIYFAFEGVGITEVCRYINPYTGVKITEYLSGSHTCDPNNPDEVYKCMQHLKYLHSRKLLNFDKFDLRKKILEYEADLKHDPADFLPDYENVKAYVLDKLAAIEAEEPEICLCHIDPVPDNFLIRDGVVHLIDWEYAALADPYMDIAMFAIYAGYDKEQLRKIITDYFDPISCSRLIRHRIYDYTAICGFLWSLWCEVKRDAGVTFGDYEKMQYNYAVNPIQ